MREKEEIMELKANLFLNAKLLARQHDRNMALETKVVALEKENKRIRDALERVYTVLALGHTARERDAFIIIQSTIEQDLLERRDEADVYDETH